MNPWKRAESCGHTWYAFSIRSSTWRVSLGASSVPGTVSAAASETQVQWSSAPLMMTGEVGQPALSVAFHPSHGFIGAWVGHEKPRTNLTA